LAATADENPGRVEQAITPVRQEVLHVRERALRGWRDLL
jgi:hypothetical protein